MKNIAIAAARRLGQESGATRVAVIALDGSDYFITTWGATRRDCRALMAWAAGRDGEAVVNQIAGTELPDGGVLSALDPEATGP